MPNNLDARQSSASPTNGDEIDIRKLIDTVLQHRRLGLAVAAFVIVCGWFYLFLAPPIYRADALLQIVQSQSPIPGMQEGASGVSYSEDQPEIQVISSRSVLSRVVRDLHLEIDAQPRRFPRYGAALARHGLGRFFRFLGHQYAWDDEHIDIGRLEVPQSYTGVTLILRAGKDGQYVLDDPNGKQLLAGEVGKAVTATVSDGLITLYVRSLKAEPGVEFTVSSDNLEDVVEGLQGSLEVAPKGKTTSMIELSMSGSDPVLITNILNSVANSYIQQNVDLHSEQADKSLQFLEQQLPDIQQQLTTAEAALQAYKSRKGAVVDLSIQGQNALGQATAVDTKISDLMMQRSALKLRFTDASPPIQAIDQQLAQLETTKKSVEDRLKTMPQTELEMIRLMRDVQVTNGLYVQLLNKAQEFKVAKAGTMGDARIVDTAVQPRGAYGPNAAKIQSITLLLALAAGIGAIFAKVALRRTLETPEPIEVQLGLPVFATIPHSDFESKTRRGSLQGDALSLLCRTLPDEPAIESLRSLRTSLQFALLEAKNNIVAIHGPTPGIGKSFVASNLAFLLADTGKSVFLIDADMRKGHVHRSLGQLRSPGLSEVISGGSKLDVATQVFEGGKLSFLATGKLPPNPAELLTHSNFQSLLQQVSKSFDFVIVDTPPTLNLADSISIGKHAGVNFLVVRGGVSTVQDVRIAQRRMEQNGIRIDGIIFNDLTATASKYAYGGYYSYKYKSGAA